MDKVKACADANEGYFVFDELGKVLYSNSSATVPYKVRVSINSLNIRTSPRTGCAVTGEKTGIGVFTIIKEKSGKGSDKGWEKLASRAGWIALDYTKRI